MLAGLQSATTSLAVFRFRIFGSGSLTAAPGLVRVTCQILQQLHELG
jgi:hypothetical protein